MSASIFWLVLELANREPAAAPIVAARGVEAAQVLLAIDATANERKILLSTGHHESRWQPRALNPDGDCGETQIRNAGMWGSSCAAILEDRAEAYRVSLRILRYARAICPGTWAHVLTVYVSGSCGKAPMKAREICSPTGLCGEVY